MAKKRIVVLYGGKADEHPISCISTAGVLKAMDTERFEPIPVGITKSGQWIVNGEDPRGWNLSGDTLPEVKVTPESRPVLLDVSRGCDGFLVGGDTVESLGHIDAVLPVLHGPYGEDGGDQFYDFDSKYMDSSASHVEVPANLPEETLQRVRETAIKAFKAVDGMGLSRVDSFVTADGAIMINEINTMPGFTPISMYPKAWEATGLSYTDLITTLIEGVL